jgi:hypothetical protein
MYKPLNYWSNDEIRNFLKTKGVLEDPDCPSTDAEAANVDRLVDVLGELALNEVVDEFDLEDAVRSAKALWG